MNLILSKQTRANVAGLIMTLLTQDSQISETTHSEGRFTLPRILNSEAGPLHPQSVFGEVLFILPASDLN